MGTSSYFMLKTEYPEFLADADIFQCDSMGGRDISWVAQVTPFIEQFSKDGDLVFDPFAGLGTSLLAAGRLGRRSVGIELDTERFMLLRKRIERHKNTLVHLPELLCADALTADYPEEVALVATNFPYFSARPKTRDVNFYNILDYDVYLTRLEEVAKKCARSLKKGGHMIVFAENIRGWNGNMIPQAYDICARLSRHFNLKEERILLYEKPDVCEGDATLTNRMHEYVFVLSRKDVGPDYDSCYDILRRINGRFPYVTIGTFGIMNSEYSGILDNPPGDVDILIPDDREVVLGCIHFFQENHFLQFQKIEQVFSYFYN
jgi:SAM-dependent methyltransferase